MPQVSRTQCIRNRPAPLESGADARVRETKLPGPISDRLSAAIVCQIVVVAAVVGLLCASSPLAVGWSVVATIVDTVNRHLVWAHSHISQKCLETGRPTLAHGNSASAIGCIVPVTGVTAALSGRLPSFPCTSLDHTVGFVRGSSGLCQFSVQASTAFGFPSQHGVDSPDYDSSAVTPRFPHGGRSSVGGSFDCNEASEPEPRVIMCLGHALLGHTTGVV